MKDSQIIELYFCRSERAITETAALYGGYCYTIADHILHNAQDAEECVNDTYMTAWNHIPPTRPRQLSSYLGKITRGLALDYWRGKHAAKRGKGQMELAIHELDQTLSVETDLEEEIFRADLSAEINRFLRGLGDTERRVFLCRYWYLDSVTEIAQQFGCSAGKVRSMLMRTRKKLKVHLTAKGGYES